MTRRALPEGPGPWVLGAWTLLLFLIWSNSFIAIGFLLGSEAQAARLDWISLTVARFLLVAAICLVAVLLLWRRDAVRVVRRHWRRLTLCGLLAVPGYNLILYYGQQHGIPPPIASLETALAPLFLMVLGAAFLGERLSRRKLLGFVIAFAGLGMIAHAKDAGDGVAYPLLVALTATAPLTWAFYSALTKPVSRECPPVLWAYLTILFGTVPLLFVAPFHGGAEMLTLDGPGWAALLYLAVLCTVFGNAAWTWLVKHLPASSVGFTIFLNPPLTTLSQALLAALLPAVFLFRIVSLEWLGGAIVLLGMAVALLRPRRPAAGGPPSRAQGAPEG